MTAQEIPFEKYVGEEVVTNTIITKGKKTFEKKFYEDNVKNVARGNAYIIGNGPSRKDFDLNKLKASGQTYGCNALYRDFIPAFIFSVDSKITSTMVKDKVYETVIPRNVRLSEAPSHGVPVIIYDKNCPGSKSYYSFTNEFMDQENKIGSAA